MQHRNMKAIFLATLVGVGLASFTWMRLASVSAPEASINQAITKNKNTWPAEVQKEFNAQFARSSVAEKEARQLLEERRLDEAEKACYHALALAPKVNAEPLSISAKQLLGDIYQAQGRYKEAIEAYKASCEHSFHNDETELKLAWCYFKVGDLKNAHKFYSEGKFFADIPANQKADYFSMLPGEETPKALEVSLLYALGCKRNYYGYPEEANVFFKKTLELAPRNALAARQIAWNLDFLGKRDEAAPYWARAAVFGKGYIAEEGKIQVNNHLMPDKIPQALADARKIK